MSTDDVDQNRTINVLIEEEANDVIASRDSVTVGDICIYVCCKHTKARFAAPVDSIV